MGVNTKSNEPKITRRSFLKWTSALSATAAVYGCGGDGDGPEEYETPVVPQEEYVMDRELKEVMGTHPHNCGGRCPFKFFVRDYGTPQAKIAKLTAAGDIPRKNSLEADESTAHIQTRACVRGYAQIKRTYSPDRLKYPLIQTKERGDVTGFKRVSWDEALDKVADMVADVYSKYEGGGGELPYIPMVAGPPNGLHNVMSFAGMPFMGFAEGAGSALSQYLGPTILPTGAPSFENMLFASIGSVGLMPGLAGGNSVYNYEKSDFIIQWGADPAVKEPNKTFFLTKAKEAGVPIVTVDAQYTDTASVLSTGFPAYNLPQFIQVRPQTDSAVAVAMAYIIYKKEWHDDTFIKENCFGFYPTQDVGKDSDGNAFPVVTPPKHPGFVAEKLDFSFQNMITKEQHPFADSALAGQDIHVPKGMSFVEYLDKLGVEKAAELGISDKEEAVVTWASQLSGVDKSTIRNFADAFAHAGDVFLENGNNGGQKTNNGMHHVWMMICLAAMCGHTVKQGGNLGVNSSDGQSNPVSFPGGIMFPQLGKDNETTYPFIAVDSNKFVDLVVTGRDGRTPEQFYNDNKSIYGVELDPTDPKLEVDMVLGSYHITNSFNTCPNTNKAVNIFTQKDGSDYRIKHYAIYEQYMTPTAAYADVILPACSHHEKPFFANGEATYFQNKLIEPMYDTKSDVDIDIELAKKLNARGINVSYSRNGKTDEELCAEAWDTATVNGITKPTFEEVKEKGVIQKEVDAGSVPNPMVGLMGYMGYTTETGKIQFFSPFYYYRDKCDLANQVGSPRVTPRVMYVEPYEGYEKIMNENNVGVKGIKYTMQFTTKHARNRAHTVYDNVSVIRDQFDYPKRAIMNPADASRRGIHDGDMVYIFNDWGCIKVGVTTSPTINEGVVSLPHGVWYRKGSETYGAWYDIDLGNSVDTKVVDGKTYYKHIVNIDIGGCENGLTHDKDFGSPKDPLCGQVGDNHFNGNLCEVSKTHPDSLGI